MASSTAILSCNTDGVGWACTVVQVFYHVNTADFSYSLWSSVPITLRATPATFGNQIEQHSILVGQELHYTDSHWSSKRGV
jgi:hypothetical protein